MSHQALPWLVRVRISVGAVRETAWFEAVDLLAFLLCRGRIGGGLFHGTAYSLRNHGRSAAPKLLGTYEAELIGVMTWVLEAGFDHFVNIGSAEGYYTVGFARRVPAARVDAFELDPEMQARLDEMAAANGVHPRIVQHGRATPLAVGALLPEATEPFLLVDIEGGERELLDPGQIPPLLRAWVLVELHPGVHADVAETLRTRFCGSHQLFLFEPQDWPGRRAEGNRLAPFHWLARFKPFRTERRGFPTPWLLMKPHSTRRALPANVTAGARRL